jgi:lactoylglutathione lyase
LITAMGPVGALGAPAPTAPPPVTPDASATKLAYIMVFVADMTRAVAFYRDQAGLKLRFASPSWSEFDTGETILALHPAGPHNPAGTTELGLTVQDLNAFYAARKAAGVAFTGPPMPQAYGKPLTEMKDPDGALISVGSR